MARGMWGDHRGDLGLRGCAVGMCRRRLRSWQVPIIIVIMIIIIILLTVKDRELASKYYHSIHVSVSPRITQVAVTQ